MFCGKCGKKLDENAKVCPYCGAPINKKLLENETTFTDPISGKKKYKRIRKIVIGAVVIAAVGIGAVAVRHNKLEDKYSTHLNEAQAYLSKDGEQSEGQQDVDNKQDSQDVKKEELSSSDKEALESSEGAAQQEVQKAENGDKETSEDSEVIQTEQVKSEKQGEWQKAYIDYVNEKVDDRDDLVNCYLIYLDEDDIPELLIDYGVTGLGRDVCYYDGQELQTVNVYGVGFDYQKKRGLLRAGGGQNTYFFESIYALEDGKFKLLAEGHYNAEDEAHIEFDENGDMICRYYWNDQEVTKEEYQAKREECYNVETETGADSTDDIAYSKQEIISYLQSLIP